jgi:hypothetical protein
MHIKEKARKKKNKSGCKKIKVQNNYITILAEILDFSPDVISIEFNTTLTFSPSQADGLNVNNVNDEIAKKINSIIARVLSDCQPHLHPDIDYGPLKDLSITIGAQFESETTYMIRQIRYSKPVKISTELYIYTKNAHVPNSFEIRFFAEPNEKETPHAKNLMQFIKMIVDHALWKDNEFGFCKAVIK